MGKIDICVTFRNCARTNNATKFIELTSNYNKLQNYIFHILKINFQWFESICTFIITKNKLIVFFYNSVDKILILCRHETTLIDTFEYRYAPSCLFARPFFGGNKNSSCFGRRFYFCFFLSKLNKRVMLSRIATVKTGKYDKELKHSNDFLNCSLRCVF